MENIIYSAWCDAEFMMKRTSGPEHEYFLGKCVALVEIFAAMQNITYLQAHAQLVVKRDKGE